MVFSTLKKFMIVPVGLVIAVIATTLPVQATPPEQAVGYWDESKARSAKPIQLLVDPKTGVAELSTVAATSVLGADWEAGGLPQVAVGKVFFSIGRSGYVCSGSIVNDGLTNVSIVVTAAHCVMDKGRFVTNWAFVPNYDGGNRVFWYAKNLVVRSEVANQRQFNRTFIEHDWAFAVIPSGTFTKNKVRFSNPTKQLDVDGAFDYVEGGFLTSPTSTAFGYPAAGDYNGLLLKYAQGIVKDDPAGYATWGMSSDLTGGASGGPWLSSLDLLNSKGSVSSVNSYKYTNDPLSMYGPKFSAKTTATFDAAKKVTGSSSSDVVVP